MTSPPLDCRCQILEGEPQSAGNDPRCEPLSPTLLRLAAHPRIVGLARSLLGQSCVLHNTGLSLVSGGSHERALWAHLPHQDQPIHSASLWQGRAPPPTHPLSLQALWMLDAFGWDNGALYVLPRTQQREEHVEAWAAHAAGTLNSTPPEMLAAAAGGLLPTRVVTGDAGDVALALGSLWHAPSTSRAGQSPRLALLFE